MTITTKTGINAKDKLAKEIIDSSSERENNRECLYISQTYLNIENQKKEELKKSDNLFQLCPLSSL